MKRSLILGLGGSGSNVAELFSQCCVNSKGVRFLAIDSDVEATERICDIPSVCMTDYSSLGRVLDKLDAKTVIDWFPCDNKDGKLSYYKSMEMGRGANGWRMKGLLSFEYMLSDPEKKAKLEGELDLLVKGEDILDKDEDALLNVYIISSLCGGTGSALFLPLALYIKNYIKVRHAKKVTVKALLSCPDVFESSLTAENKVKAYANSYASIKELNAVELVSKGYNQTAEQESKIKVGFKIGSKKSAGIGLLFDSNDASFGNPEAQPFSRVYLFDKIPGLSTPRAHEQFMANALNVICEEDPNEQFDDIYAGISVAEIEYDYQSIVNYVASQKIYDNLTNEWLYLYSQAVSRMRDEDKAHFGGDYNLLFAQTLLEEYGAITGISKFNEFFALGRDRDADDDVIDEMSSSCPEFTLDDVDAYIHKIALYVQKTFEDQNFNVIKELGEDKTEFKPFGMFDSKAKKQQKLDLFVGRVNTCVQSITAFHKFCLDSLITNTNAVLEQLTADEGEISINNLLKKDGKNLHPVTAILALSALYQNLVNSYGSTDENQVSKALFNDFDGVTPVKQAFIKKDISATTNKLYDGLGKERLLAVYDMCQNSDQRINKIITLGGVYTQESLTTARGILSAFTMAVMEKVIEKVSKIFSSYKSLFDLLPEVLDDNKVDVRLALMNGNQNTCTLMNVGAFEQNKLDVYSEFLKSDVKNVKLDYLSGELFADYVNREDKVSLFKDLVELERPIVKENPVISRVCDYNIFRVLHERELLVDQLPKRTKYNDFNQALSLVALPLDVAVKEIKSEDKTVVQTVTLIPQEAGDFAKEFINEPDIDAQLAVNKYLFSQGAIEADVSLSQGVARNKILAIKKILNFEPWLFNKLNETNDNSNYYKNYVKAQGVKVLQSTQLWNPHLVKDNPSGDYLPFISPAQQETYEQGVYKAVLYMLKKSVVFVKPNETNKDAFYITELDKSREVTFEKKQVLFKDTHLLFGFARENAQLAINYANAYDKEIELECDKYPLLGYENSDLPLIRKAISEGSLAKLFTENIFASLRSVNRLKGKTLIDFIFELLENEKTKKEAVNFAKVLNSVLVYQCQKRVKGNEESFQMLYNGVLADIKQKYDKKAKQSDQKTDKKKLDAVLSLISGDEE